MVASLQVCCGRLRAHCLARELMSGEAVALAADAVALGDATDAPHLRWHALMSHAEVLSLAGRTSDAEASYRDAIRAAEQKQNVVGMQLAREARERLVTSRGASAP